MLDYATSCLANFPLAKEIRRDLRHMAEDTLLAVFGENSREMARFKQYRDNWNSNEDQVRKNWLVCLRQDLQSAKHRLESTPEERYQALRIGIVENETLKVESVAVRLGLKNSDTRISRRMMELSRRAQMNIENDSPDGAAFFLRKMLEIAIIQRFREDGRESEIIQDGEILGLQNLLNKASQSSGGGYIPSKTIKELKAEKFFLDSSVHDWAYDPRIVDIERTIGYIQMAFEALKVNELR